MPRPIDLYGDELKPVALYTSSGRALGPNTLTLVNALVVRDTVTREYVADVSGYPRKLVAVANTLDQTVNVVLGFSMSATAPVLVGSFAGPLAVPAGSMRYIGADGASNASFIGDARLGPK
jgi:hypothetical protein